MLFFGGGLFENEKNAFLATLKANYQKKRFFVGFLKMKKRFFSYFECKKYTFLHFQKAVPPQKMADF